MRYKFEELGIKYPFCGMQNAPLVGLWERENYRTFAAEIQTLLIT
jgi:hypothetical protein